MRRIVVVLDVLSCQYQNLYATVSQSYIDICDLDLCRRVSSDHRNGDFQLRWFDEADLWPIVNHSRNIASVQDIPSLY